MKDRLGCERPVSRAVGCDKDEGHWSWRMDKLRNRSLVTGKGGGAYGPTSPASVYKVLSSFHSRVGTVPCVVHGRGHCNRRHSTVPAAPPEGLI
jgi:hypothetical protein